MFSIKKLLPFCAVLLLCSCASVEEGTKYAELRVASKDEQQVLIYADQWDGLFTVHGLGGMVHNLHYWVTLAGPGPEYRDPVLTINSNTQFNHRGTVTVDRKHQQVVIDMVRIVSKSGEPEVLEPSPANGTYPIKNITREPFFGR